MEKRAINYNMRREEFRADCPGELVQISDGWAFVPEGLPPTVELSWELASSLDRATQSLARLDGQASLIQNRALVMRPLETREAVESARLEGTHTHIAGVLLQQAAGPSGDPIEASNNQEVINYLCASARGETWLGEGRPVTVHLIRSLHEMLLRGTRGEQRRPGEFRLGQVLIGAQGDTPATARFVPPPPEQVPPLVDGLVEFMGHGDPFPPLIAAGIAHYQFEAIHPFEDGNGRLGRLLIPLHLLGNGGVGRPLVYLSPFFERRRDEYLRLLKAVSTNGAWLAWLSFFLEAVRVQADDARERVTRITALRETYRERAQALRSKVPTVAIDLVMDRIVVTAPDLAQYARCAYKTAVSALDALRQLGIVAPLRQGHPQRWWAKELVERVYED